MSPRLASLVRWVAGTALVALAWVVLAITPGSDLIQQPFTVQASVGEPAVGRNLRITVLDVRKAEKVTDRRGWFDEGPWLLVTFEAEATETEERASLQRVRLHIGDRIYVPTDRADGATWPAGQLSVDLAQTATAAFELPEEDADAAVWVDFGINRSDPRLDSLIRLDVDLAALEPEPSIEIPSKGWSE